MKFFVSLLLTALVAFAFGLYLPWWTVSLGAFLVATVIYQPPLRSFLVGFFGVFLLWLILLIMINSSNESILAPKIGNVMGFGGSAFTLILLSCLIGAVVGGLGAVTGSLLRRVRWVS